jgi:hypothetical protein
LSYYHPVGNSPFIIIWCDDNIRKTIVKRIVQKIIFDGLGVFGFCKRRINTGAIKIYKNVKT